MHVTYLLKTAAEPAASLRTDHATRRVGRFQPGSPDRCLPPAYRSEASSPLPPTCGVCQGCPWSTSVLWRCLGDSMEPGSQRKAGLLGKPLPTTKPGKGSHQPAHPAFRAPEAGRWTKDVGPTQRGGWPGGWERAPRSHKPAGLCVAFECPHGPHLLRHSPGARTGPLLTPEPWEGAPQGLDLGGARCTPSSARTAA